MPAAQKHIKHRLLRQQTASPRDEQGEKPDVVSMAASVPQLARRAVEIQS
jgi:hypothetical protein